MGEVLLAVAVLAVLAVLGYIAERAWQAYCSASGFDQQWRAVDRMQERRPQTHMLPLDGVTARLMLTYERGRKVVLSGYTMRHREWCKGDFLVIHQGGLVTRYQIDNITRYGNPPDQYAVDCTFAPRGNAR